MLGSASVLRGNALALPLDDDSVDLCVTSPPYWSLRSYQDDGRHYEGQVGSEAAPDEFIDNLIAATREMVRVTKPSGSIFVNLGDKFSSGSSGDRNNGFNKRSGNASGKRAQERSQLASRPVPGMRPKSLMLLPQRYAIRCVDELGLILRAEIIWSKPNGLPESVTDRVRRSHEVWWHFTLEPRYFSAVDEIRETYELSTISRNRYAHHPHTPDSLWPPVSQHGNPLGKLPGSVWTVPTEPLRVPDHLGIDHFAAFPTAWPRRIISGWSPAGVCVECGEGRRPVTLKRVEPDALGRLGRHGGTRADAPLAGPARTMLNGLSVRTVTGYACACPVPTAPTTPSIILDPFGGTGTTALVAKALGRHGISVDMSADYCRLAAWRTNDRDQLAKVLGIAKAEPADDAQDDLLGLIEETA